MATMVHLWLLVMQPHQSLLCGAISISIMFFLFFYLFFIWSVYFFFCGNQTPNPGCGLPGGLWPLCYLSGRNKRLSIRKSCVVCVTVMLIHQTIVSWDRVQGQHLWEADGPWDRLADPRHRPPWKGLHRGHQWGGGAPRDAQGNHGSHIVSQLKNDKQSSKTQYDGEDYCSTWKSSALHFLFLVHKELSSVLLVLGLDVQLISNPPRSLDWQVLGPMAELGESTPEEDTKADRSNSAHLYKVSTKLYLWHQPYI